MTQDKNPKKATRREAKRRRRFPPDAACMSCGESDPRVFEQHHPMGRAHQPDVKGVLCRNCHAKATEGQRREEAQLRPTQTLLDRVAAIFGNLAAFFRFLAESFDRLVQQIKAFAGRLDEQLPQWRVALGDGS